MTTTENGHRHLADEDTVAVPRQPLGYPGQQTPAPGHGPYPDPQFGGWATGFPPPPFPMHAARPRRGLRALPRNTWIAIAAATVLVIVMVAVTVLTSALTSGGGDSAQTPRRYASPTTTAAAQPADPAKLVGSAKLPGVLLGADEAAALLGHAGGAADAKIGQIYTLPAADVLLAGNECLALAYPAEQTVYQGSGFTSMRLRYSRAKIGTPMEKDWVFNQAVFAYPSEQAAQNFLATSTDKWKACQGRSWGNRETYDTGTRDVYWSGGPVLVNEDGLLTAPITQENGDGWGCWRAMTAASNVVTEFSACGLRLPDSTATAAAAAITRKIRSN